VISLPALSFQRGFVDDLLSGRKQQTTRPQTDRFKVGGILHIYIEQRNKIIDKPIRQMTGIGTTAMADRVNDTNYNYPLSCGIIPDRKLGDMPSYYAHFLGKVEITDVQRFMPSEHWGDEGADIIETWARLDGFKDFAAADEWFSSRYKYWLDTEWTVIGWNGWIERYFESQYNTSIKS